MMVKLPYNLNTIKTEDIALKKDPLFNYCYSIDYREEEDCCEHKAALQRP